jgi:hypothetical protein
MPRVQRRRMFVLGQVSGPEEEDVEDKGSGPAILPEHIEDTIRSVADLRKRHQ